MIFTEHKNIKIIYSFFDFKQNTVILPYVKLCFFDKITRDFEIFP